MSPRQTMHFMVNTGLKKRTMQLSESDIEMILFALSNLSMLFDLKSDRRIIHARNLAKAIASRVPHLKASQIWLKE